MFNNQRLCTGKDLRAKVSPEKQNTLKETLGGYVKFKTQFLSFSAESKKADGDISKVAYPGK